MTHELAQAYLSYRREEGIGQKQLDNDRNAMQFMTGKLSRVMSTKHQELSSRAYTKTKVDRIANRQSSHHALAARIAYDAGFRAHDLQTLRRSDQAEIASSRQWRSDLFQGRSAVRYVVKGKIFAARF